MKHNDGCFCPFCMAAHKVWELRKALAEAEVSLEMLAQSQRVSAADMLKIVDARRTPTVSGSRT